MRSNEMEELMMTARTDWTREEITALFDLPFNDLMFEAQSVHRANFPRNEVQLSTLLSIKDRLFYSFIVRDGDRHSAADPEYARPVEARRDPNDRSVRDRVPQRSEVGDDDLRARDVRERRRRRRRCERRACRLRESGTARAFARERRTRENRTSTSSAAETAA